MADDDSLSTTTWPIPKFYFQVKWDSETMSFQEISGLDVEAETIEFRSGDSLPWSATNMPGIKKDSNVTMKRGIYQGNSKFQDWFNQVKLDTTKRTPLIIRLLDESGVPTMVWTLANAYLVKISGADLKSDGDEVAIESMEVAHEGITIVNG